MSCEDTREQMMALDTAALDQLPHLQHCASCRALADQIRAAEAALGDHVASFAQGGDFDAQWQRARAHAQAPTQTKRPRWWLVAAPALAAAVALLVLQPPPPDVPEPLPVAADPAPAAESPAPAVEAPAPVTPPPATAAPRPAPRRPTRSAPSPLPPPPPPPPPPAPEYLLTIHQLPAEASGIMVRCADGAYRAAASHGRASVSLASGSSCTITLQGVSVPDVESGPGAYTYVAGRLEPR